MVDGGDAFSHMTLNTYAALQEPLKSLHLGKMSHACPMSISDIIIFDRHV